MIKAVKFSVGETHYKWSIQLIPQRTRKVSRPRESYNQYFFYPGNYIFTYGCGQKVCWKSKVNANENAYEPYLNHWRRLNLHYWRWFKYCSNSKEAKEKESQGGCCSRIEGD